MAAPAWASVGGIVLSGLPCAPSAPPCDDEWRYVVDFAAGIKLGNWKGSPPVLWAKGKLDSYGISTLDALADEAWNLLPDTAFADVVIPVLPGHVTFNTSTANATGNSTMHVRASGSAPELLSISGVVSIEDVNATLDIPEYDPSGSLIPESYTLTFEASAVLGGDGGFKVGMGGTIEQDVETGLSAVLYAVHDGGWSPLPGPLGEKLKTSADEVAAVESSQPATNPAM